MTEMPDREPRMRSNEERAMDADLALAEPSALVKAAAVAQSLASLMVGLSGLQLIGARWVSGIANYVPYLLIVLGVVGIVLAANQYRARTWAGIGSGVFGVIMAITMIAWVIYTLTSIMSCLMYLAVPLSSLSAILSLVAVGAVNQTAAARKRLADRGMDLGL